MVLSITLNPAIDRVYFLEGLEIGEANRPAEMTYTAGGKGLNVARVLTIMGQKVACGGFVGGYNGKYIRAQVSAQGMEDRFLEIPGETRICINITDRSTGKSTEVLEPGPMVSEEDCARFLQQFETDLKACSLVTVSGSLPKGVPVDFYAKMIALARSQEKKILVDTSGAALEAAIEAKPYFVKPNRAELSKYLGKPVQSVSEVKEAVLELQARGVEFPCVTLGRDGAVAALEDGVYQFVSPDLPVVNTVGSGDSFVAGTAYGLAQGMRLMDTVKMAMACATANTQFEKTGMVSTELVQELLGQITVFPV